MPSMTADDDHPFDPRATCIGMGIVAQTFWQLPGVLRSDSPHARRGWPAGCITAPHPVDVPHGLDSPAGRVYELDGQVLLLGVDHTANTTIHLGEYMRRARYRRKKYVTLLKEGRLSRFDYTEIDHCCHELQPCRWLAGKRRVAAPRPVGRAEARLVRSSDVIRVVTEKIQQNETVFLHPFGVDECG